MCDSNFLCLVFWRSCAVGEVFFRYSVPRRCIVMFANHYPLEKFGRTCSVFCADQPGGLWIKGVTDTVSSNDASWSEHADLNVFSNIEFIYLFVLCIREIKQKTTPWKYLFTISFFTEHHLFESLMVGFTRVHSYTVYLGHGSRAIVLLWLYQNSPTKTATCIILRACWLTCLWT